MESYLKSDLGALLQGFNRMQTRGGRGVISKPDLGARPGFNRTDNGMRGW